MVPITDSVARRYLKQIFMKLCLDRPLRFHDFMKSRATWAFHHGVLLAQKSVPWNLKIRFCLKLHKVGYIGTGMGYCFSAQHVFLMALPSCQGTETHFGLDFFLLFCLWTFMNCGTV